MNPSASRYETMRYRLCGKSGLRLPLISLGLWQNFGENRPIDIQKAIVHRAFDLGVIHFDLANNYGPPFGEAERNFGRILCEGLGQYRDELVVSTKAGYRAWPGPNGDGGGKKNLIASCESSLKRTGLDYFDIFYHHRMDGEISVEESMGALDQLVKQGKALHIGVSSHTGEHFDKACAAIQSNGLTRLTSLMSRYNLLERNDETKKWPFAEKYGAGGIAFCPLAEGLLTNKYLAPTMPEGSRLIAKAHEAKVMENLKRIPALNEIAVKRGQTLAQMSLAWLLNQPVISSALIGASSVKQLEENVSAISNLQFSEAELSQIDAITKPV